MKKLKKFILLLNLNILLINFQETVYKLKVCYKIKNKTDNSKLKK